MPTDDVTSPSDRSHERLQGEREEKLRELVYRSMSGEFASVRDGRPTTFPLTPFYDADRGSVVISSPVAYAGKVRNVERDPRVSMLLHDPDGEYLVTGDARVRDDDPEANAAYVRALSESEPATPKRAANEEKYEFLESRLGNALVGWAGERLAVEIEPVSMDRVGDASPVEELPAWRAAGMDRTEALEYERAVLTVVGADGYPETRPVTSLRVRDGAARIEPGPATTPGDGQPACLLLHWHDEASVHLGQRIVRGRFRTGDGPPRFVPGSCSTLRNDGLLSTLRFVVDGKRRTRAYYRRDHQSRDR